MKFLENIKLEQLSTALSKEPSDCLLDFKVESYSCKMVANDKRIFKGMLHAEGPEKNPHELVPLSPPVTENIPWCFPQHPPGLSPNTSYGRSVSGSTGSDQEDKEQVVLCDTISFKVLFHLTTLLNNTFSDYDFTDAKGDNFCLHDLESVYRSVDTQLSSVIESYPTLRDEMWSILNEEISLKECIIYSYKPDYLSDPFSEDGCIWSFNYFFYNKRLKRILFLACRALCPQIVAADFPDETMWNIDE